MPDRTDRDRLADFIQIIGAEPRETKFDYRGHLIKLNLAGLSLTSLPLEIAHFIHLKELLLGEVERYNFYKDNQKGYSVVDVIGLGNQLQSLPNEICQLGNLDTLSLVNNNFTNLPLEIVKLPKLERLNLLGNNITSVSSSITQLSKLKSLKLSSNSLKTLPPEISHLANLKDLFIIGFDPITTPLGISQLTKLKALALWGNGFKVFPSEIAQLSNLDTLNFAANNLVSFPAEILRLISLEYLWMWGNELTTLPTEIQNLTNLRHLSLHSNRLRILPSEISYLSNLQYLDLSYNNLTSFPLEVFRLSSLENLSLKGNLLRTPPPEILARDTADILDFLRELANGAVTRYEAKLLIVGEGKTGKSSLLRALRGEPYVEGLKTTHGIEIKPYPFSHPDKSEATITLNVWDFGGQQIYHTTHQFFMTKRSLYLLVWNARGDTDQGRLDHWLRNIQVLAPAAPIIMVATHIDERPADFNFERFKAAYPQIVGFVGVSNKSGAGIEDLKQMLARQAVELELMEQQWPQTWVAAETALTVRRDYHLTQASYTNICVRQRVPKKIAQTVLGGYLHDLGKILYYQDDDALCDFVVLKPNWLTQAISRVLDDDITRQNGGVLAHADFFRLWDKDENGKPYDRRLYPLFRRLMERFLISFQLESETPYQPPNHSLVPLLLPHSLPEGMSPWEKVLPDQPEINMVFRLVNFVPPGLMSWFIVLTHLYTQGLHWREGCRLQYEGHQAQVELNPSTRELWLRVRGPAPSNFFNILQHTVNDRILERYFEGLEYKRQVPCNCYRQRGDDKACPYFHDYERLAERMKRGILEAECDVSFARVSVPELLEGIHYTTNDRVYAKLEQIQVKVEQSHEKIEDMQIHLAQGFEQLKRDFSRLWNYQLASLNAECPSTFILLPGNRRRINPKNIFSNEYTMYLLCQHPAGPHLVKDEKGYPVPQAKEWWTAVAPWLKQLTTYLRYIPKIGGIAEVYDEQFYKTIELNLKIFEVALDTIPDDLKAADAVERMRVAPGRFEPFEAEGPALRTLHSFLKEADKSEHWGGLRKTPTNDGNIFWLCAEHQPLYKPL